MSATIEPLDRRPLVTTGNVVIEFPDGIENEVVGIGAASPCDAYDAVGVSCTVLTQKWAYAVDPASAELPDIHPDHVVCLTSQQLQVDRDSDPEPENSVPMPYTKVDMNPCPQAPTLLAALF